MHATFKHLLLDENMIQLSMNGPGTNWNVLTLLDFHCGEKEWPYLIGSCGLHVMYGAFQTGTKTTGWNVDEIVKTMWQDLSQFSCKKRSVYLYYLFSFQTNNPMLPFLADAIEKILRKILKMFIKKEVLEHADTPFKFVKLDVSKKENHCAVEMVDLGTITKDFLRSIECSIIKKYQCKKDCLAILVAIIKKI